MTPFEDYAAPETVEEAVRLIAHGSSTLFAGGTDLVPRIKSQDAGFNPLLINIRRIRELRGISETKASVRIGTLTTVAEIRKDSILADQAVILSTAADSFASGQVRHVATVGGNICNASPAGDLIIPLLLLDAEVELASWRDEKVVERSVPLFSFFLEPGQTRIKANEILTAIRFPKAKRNLFAEFRKFGTRPAMDIAVVSVGVAGLQEDGVLRHVRVAFGAVAPTPLRARRTEATIEGRVLNDEVIGEAVHAAVEEISPISDVRASAWYRRELITVLLKRILTNACG